MCMVWPLRCTLSSEQREPCIRRANIGVEKAAATAQSCNTTSTTCSAPSRGRSHASRRRRAALAASFVGPASAPASAPASVSASAAAESAAESAAAAGERFSGVGGETWSATAAECTDAASSP